MVAPYEASPVWKGDTLMRGDLKLDCRHTPTSGALFCYLRRSVTVASCTEDVHFVTDGSLQQFDIAAFAAKECSVPVKTCNTYR